MSTTTEAIDLVDNLVKANIPKETAKQLVDYADKQKEDYATKADISMLKWAVGISAVAVFTLFGLVWQVNEKVNTIDKKLDKLLLKL